MKKVNLFRDVAKTYASDKNPNWTTLAVRSKEIYLNGMKYLDKFNDFAVDEITRPMVIEHRDDMYSMTGMCRVSLTVLSNVLSYAHDRGMVEYNQAFNLRGLPPKVEIKRWEQEEIDKFLDTAPLHLRQAVLLALYTGQRRSDLVRVKWDDYDGDTIRLTQVKTKKVMVIPCHKRLQTMLEGMKLTHRRHTLRILRHPYILSNAWGQPQTAENLRAAIKEHLFRIGIKDRSIHGLRKSAASFLAEAGCTTHQIQAVTGHVSLKEVENYTRQANQKRLAREAMDQWR